MNNYIIPLIGDIKLDDVTPRLIDRFYRSLPKVKTKVSQNRKPKNEYLPQSTRYISCSGVPLIRP